ncbi:hypothetical protein [Micromonospora coxensis]|uniref:Uncharacterized protein n=1 Tax=Micromonospora coxensis TaxID=356852 RepID=A0A1C5I065_9ACTN|nr:hypothetical protein [Micromonospora coxensis]SCG51628.1 hypothetical protein GA0070614_2029 [Micromonospora coxensis]
MREDAAPFFIAPHRFDAPDDECRPMLDRDDELVPEPGEQVLRRVRAAVAGCLLSPTGTRRQWVLPAPATVTVTDRRLAYVCAGAELSVVPGRDGGGGTRHRRGLWPSRLVSGQIRWQWPSRLELPVPGRSDPEVLVVCDSLRTIQQPALALAGPSPTVVELARLVRRAVARFRITRPELVDLSPPERDELVRRAGPVPLAGQSRIALPGSLPVEFLSRDDYYRTPAPPTWDAVGG